MDTFLGDLRYAARRLMRAPAFTLVAVLTLALGIGANTAMFSVIRSVLLAPLPYGEPERVVTLWNRWKGWDKTWLSEPEVLDYQREVKSFEHFAAYSDGAGNLTGGARPERVALASVTANTFAALGAKPILGRTFAAEEDVPGRDGVAVLGYGLWKRRFGGDPGIVGRSIEVNGRSRIVLGVIRRASTSRPTMRRRTPASSGCRSRWTWIRPTPAAPTTSSPPAGCAPARPSVRPTPS